MATQKSIHSDEYRRLVEWLKAARKLHGMTMRQLGKRMGVSHTWIQKVEQCERRLDLIELVQLCRALKLDPVQGVNIIKKMKSKAQAPIEKT